MPDTDLPPGLLSALRLAIGDPSTVLPRKETDADGHPFHELLTHWQERAVAEAIRPFLAKPVEPGRDVIHSPLSDWCACEPGGRDRCGYRLLADAVCDSLNPPDGEDAEVAICIEAIERVAGYVTSLPCACTPEMADDWDQCERCAALGQRGGKPVQR